MHLSKGSTLQAGKYTVEKILGQGSFGITYLATARFTNEGNLGRMDVRAKVAIKEFFMRDLNLRAPDGSSVEGSIGSVFVNYRGKFRREAENLAKLVHPNIVRIFDIFDENGTSYYVMEYLEGDNLDEYITAQGRLSEPEALSIIRDIAESLDYMHSRKMLHLDVKPKNIMHRASDSNILIDFGLSKQFSERGEPETSTSIGLGTPGYAPLEQSQFRREGSFPATLDVYALGATLYKLLTDTRPPEATVILNEGFPVNSLKEIGITPKIIVAVEKAMHPMKKNRYQCIRQFIEALGQFEQMSNVDSKPEETQYVNTDAVIVEINPQKRQSTRKEKKSEDLNSTKYTGNQKSSEKRVTKHTIERNFWDEAKYGCLYRNPITNLIVVCGVVWFFCYITVDNIDRHIEAWVVLRYAASFCCLVQSVRMVLNRLNGWCLPLIFTFALMFISDSFRFYDKHPDQWWFCVIFPYCALLLSFLLKYHGKPGYEIARKIKYTLPLSYSIMKKRSILVNSIEILGFVAICFVFVIKSCSYFYNYDPDNPNYTTDLLVWISTGSWVIGQIYVVLGYRLGMWILWYATLMVSFYCWVRPIFLPAILLFFITLFAQGILLLRKNKKSAWSVMK